jgi:hypothetical protein
MTTQIVNWFDKSLSTVVKAGVAFNSPDAKAATLVAPLVARLEKFDAEKALTVARTLQTSGSFNDLVMREIGAVDIGTRFLNISNDFNSIRADLSKMVSWMDDGKLDLSERLSRAWMEFRRGTVAERFQKIRAVFGDVILETSQQINKENLILSAYKEFRFAVKEAEGSAAALLQKAEAHLKDLKLKSEAVNQELSKQDNPEAVARLELERDVLISNIAEADSDYQLAKDLFENLKVSYNASELIFARIQQNVSMKEQVQQRSVVFFSTNELVFTGLATAFTSTQGLAESTLALEQMKAGVNNSIEDLAKHGTKQLESSTKAAYGATINVSSIKALADSIVEYQSSLSGLISDLRQEATATAIEIERETNQAKTKYALLMKEI